jgi:hypothetical protein
METKPTNENAPLAGEAKVEQLIAVRNQYKGDGRADQGTRLLAALRLFSVSTFEARKHLDVMHPAGRVQELREDGREIETLRRSEPSEVGRPHSIAVYVLRNEVQP